MLGFLTAEDVYQVLMSFGRCVFICFALVDEHRIYIYVFIYVYVYINLYLYMYIKSKNLFDLGSTWLSEEVHILHPLQKICQSFQHGN